MILVSICKKYLDLKVKTFFMYFLSYKIVIILFEAFQICVFDLLL